MIKVFVWDEIYEWYIQWFKEDRIQKLFLDNGIKLVFSDPKFKCDAVIANYATYNDTYQKFKDMPYSVKFTFESHDGTFPRTLRECLHDNKVKGIFKHTIFRDFKTFAKNYPFYWAAGHFELIAREFPELRDSYYIKGDNTIVLNDEEIDRVDKLLTIGCPLLYQPPYLLEHKFQFIKEKDILNNNRPVDVFFAGETDYGNAEWLSFVRMHRKEYVRLLNELSSEFNIVVNDGKNRLGPREFTEAGLSSKIMVSPYGIGSFSYRDWEVLLFGCEGIRPYTDYMKTYPDIYNPDLKAFHQPKKFRDINELRDMIKYLISIYNKPDNIELRMIRYKLVRDAADDHKPIVDIISNKIKSELEKC